MRSLKHFHGTLRDPAARRRHVEAGGGEAGELRATFSLLTLLT